MKVLISGSTGLVGSALVRLLTSDNHHVTRLVRPGGPITHGSVLWDPQRGLLDSEAIEGHDAVVHLAGENIAAGRWTADQKKRIRESRVRGTSMLCGRLKSLKKPPTVALFASAIGIYGDRSDEELTEQSTPGPGFLAMVTKEWEAASDVLAETSIRVVKLRIGVVLSKEGGALVRILPVFKFGLGGKIGSGRQYMSWIAIDDLLNIVKYVLSHDNISGAVNAVSPNPATNEEFTKSLGKLLSRPTIFSVPRLALKLAAGEMGNELLLASTRVLPEKLISSGFRFEYPDLEQALKHVLGR